MASAVVAFKELPAAPTDGSKALAGLVKELPAAATAGSKALAGLVKEVSSASAAPYVPGRSVGFSIRRLPNTKGALSRRDIDDDNDDTATEEPTGEDTADDRLRALQLSSPKLFSTDALEFAKPMKLSQLLAALTEDGGAESGTRFSGHGWWVSKEDDTALQLKVAMPGVGKEHVTVTADKNILLIKGEGVKDPEDGKGPAQYNRRIQLPAEAFKMDQIKAKMDNGVLKVTVPKIKDEERKDVFQIKVE